MGGSSDESKPSILVEPLLPSPSPPPISYDSDPTYPPPISYTHSPRPLRDLLALLLFLLLSLSTFALGIFSIAHHNPHHHSTSFTYSPFTSSCTLTAPPSITLNSMLAPLKTPSSHLEKNLIWTLVATAALAGPIAMALLALIRRFAKQIVYAFIPFFLLIPSFLNVYWFVACSLSDACARSFPLPYRILVLVFVFLLIAVFLWIIVANWHRIELTVKIVRIGAVALGDNLGLVGVLPALGLGLVVYYVPVVVSLVFARWNGRVLPRERGNGEYECVWKQDGWVPAYFALAIVTMIWMAAVMVEAQVYVISGTVAQWYFATEGTKPRRSIRSSLR